MNQREAFLKLLAENEDDITARLVFADWLDDNGEHEEAERMRLWPEAKKWLVEFCEELKLEITEEMKEWGYTEEELEEEINHPNDGSITYDELVQMATRAYRNADVNRDGEITSLEMYCGDRETMMYKLQPYRVEFWKQWSILTGNPLPKDLEEVAIFRCAC